MVIVSGFLTVRPEDRDPYLASCADVVRTARSTEGCLDFVLGADLVDPTRINVHERWESRAAVEAFRGDGPSGDQVAMLLAADVGEYDVTPVRPAG